MQPLARRYSVWPVRDAELNNLCKLRESRPNEYLRVKAATLPKRLETEPAQRPVEELTDEELDFG